MRGWVAGVTVPSLMSFSQMKSVAHLPWRAFTYKVSTLQPPSPPGLAVVGMGAILT